MSDVDGISKNPKDLEDSSPPPTLARYRSAWNQNMADPEYGGTRMWRLPDIKDPEFGDWVSSHALTKRKLRPEVRSASGLTKFLDAYRNFRVPPREMNGLISQAHAIENAGAPFLHVGL